MTTRPTIIKRQRVQLESTSRIPTYSNPASARDTGCEQPKSVRTVDVGGRIQAIELTCACGEVTVIELDYENGATEARTA